MTLPRRLTAVPQAWPVRMEIVKAAHALVAQIAEEEERRRQAELANTRRDCELLVEALREACREYAGVLRTELRKAGYNPSEPRVPAGNPDGGQWTSGGESGASVDSTIGPDHSGAQRPVQYAALDTGTRPSLSTPYPQVAQALPPSILFQEPPLIVRPPLPTFPEDPTVSPGPGFRWYGRPGSQPGDPYGSWHNPDTDESLRPDMDHLPPIPPHWDYKAPNGQWYRWFPDGRLELRS